MMFENAIRDGVSVSISGRYLVSEEPKIRLCKDANIVSVLGLSKKLPYYDFKFEYNASVHQKGKIQDSSDIGNALEVN